MDRERWQQICAIFDAVAEAPPNTRAAMLDSLCAADAEMRRDVEALLAADSRAAHFDHGVDAARVASAATWAVQVDGVERGERIGPWRVLGELGRGGMGVVLLAERADGQFEQRTALKLIKRGMDSDAVQARFLRERQILARLQHPHIARLLDGGIAADGRPYFAMEYVDGRPLLRHCAEEVCRLERRLGLFLDVCDAVQFAHGQLVVHRDIKPSNIMVDAAGEGKLLDFGIAKLIGEGDRGTTIDPAQRLLTPAYAAPEQLRGDAVSTATDIYALGAVLYELLTARRPHDLADDASEDSARAVQTTAIPPSRIGDGPVPARRLRGDLDTIVLKALHPEPQRRYATVAALADDLRRFLADLPILARRDSAAYRARKFARRHWIGVAATLVVAAALIAGTTVSLYEARAARAQAARAQTVTRFLADMFRFADPKGMPGGVRMTAKEMLDAGAQRIDQELGTEPELAAEFATTLGGIYTELGEYDRAIALTRHALDLSSDDADRTRALADLARAQYEKGDYPAAAENVDKAKMLHISSGGPRSAAVAADIALSGEIARRQGDFKRAEALTLQALAQSRAALAAPHAQIAAQLNQLATLYADMRRLADARAPTEQALAMFRALYGENHLDVAENLANLGVLDMQTDKIAEALPLFEKAEAIYRKLLAQDHPLLASVLANEARALDRSGRYAESRAKYLQALAMQRELLGTNHPDVAATLNNMSVLAAEQGDYRTAGDLCRQVVAIWQALGQPDHPMALTTRIHLASALRELGDANRSESMLRDALAATQKKLGEKHPVVLLASIELAMTLRDEGRLGEALALQRALQGSVQSAQGLPTPIVAEAAIQLALSELAAGHLDAAREQVGEARKRLDAMKTVDAVAEGEALQAQARVALAQQDTANGCAAAEQALDLALKKFGDNGVRAARAHLVHAQCLRQRQRNDEAEAEDAAARKQLVERLGVSAPAAQ